MKLSALLLFHKKFLSKKIFSIQTEFNQKKITKKNFETKERVIQDSIHHHKTTEFHFCYDSFPFDFSEPNQIKHQPSV